MNKLQLRVGVRGVSWAVLLEVANTVAVVRAWQRIEEHPAWRHELQIDASWTGSRTGLLTHAQTLSLNMWRIVRKDAGCPQAPDHHRARFVYEYIDSIVCSLFTETVWDIGARIRRGEL